MQHNDRVELEDLLSLAREAFISCNFEGALKYAIAAVKDYPESAEAYAYLAAYGIYKSANKKTETGETDWYALMGVEPGAFMDRVYNRYCDIEELLTDVEVKEFPGRRGARNLIRRTMRVLGEYQSKRDYDVRRWPWMSVQSIWSRQYG